MRNNKSSIVRMLLPAFILMSLLACNSKPEQNKNYNNNRDEVNDAFGSNDTFGEKVDEALDDFSTRLENFNKDFAIKKGQVSDDTRKSLKKLNEESLKLKEKVNRLGEKTGKEADKLGREIREDYKEFKKDVDAFFERNK